MASRTVRAAVSLLVVTLVLSACTGTDQNEVNDDEVVVGWDEDVIDITDRPMNAVDAPDLVANRPQTIEFTYRDDTLVLETTTAAELVDDTTVSVPVGELATFDGDASDVAYVVAPPTDLLPDGLNEVVLAVVPEADAVRFTVEPVEFGAPFAHVDIDVTDQPTDASLQELTDAINRAAPDGEPARYEASVVDVADIVIPDDDTIPLPDTADDEDPDATTVHLEALPVAAPAADGPAVTLASYDATEPTVLAAADDFSVPGPRDGAARYQPDKGLHLRIQEWANCPPNDDDGTYEAGWRDGLTVTGDLCDADRFALTLDVHLIPSFDFKYDSTVFGRPKHAVVGLNAQTVVDLNVKAARRGVRCNDACKQKLEREKDAVQKTINDAGDLLELFDEARLALAMMNRAGLPNVHVGFGWPLHVTYAVDGTFDASVSGFVGAGVTWDKSRPKNDRAQPYVTPLQIDSRADLKLNAAVKLITGPEIQVLVARMFGPTVSVQGTLDGAASARATKLDATWNHAVWTDRAWNVDYELEGVVKLRAQDPFIGKVNTDWELLRHTFTHGTLIRSTPTHPRVRAQQAVGGGGDITLTWTEPAHADRYQVWVADDADACRAAANGTPTSGARMLAVVTGDSYSFDPTVGATVVVACVVALGRGPTGQPTRSRSSSVVDLTVPPAPPIPVEFDTDAWFAEPFDLSSSVCNPPDVLESMGGEWALDQYPGWKPESVVRLDERLGPPDERRAGDVVWWNNGPEGGSHRVDGSVGQVTPVAQGDLTGDGRNEALIIIDCWAGMNTSMWELVAYGRDSSGSPLRLGQVYDGVFSSQGGSVLPTADVEIVGGEVRITTVETARLDSGDFGFSEQAADRTFRWDGTRFTQQ